MHAKAEVMGVVEGRSGSWEGVRGMKSESRETQEMEEGGSGLEHRAGACTCSCNMLLLLLMLLLLTNTTTTRSDSDDAAGNASVGVAPGPAADLRAYTDARSSVPRTPLLLLSSRAATPVRCSIAPMVCTPTCENCDSGNFVGMNDDKGRPPPSTQEEDSWSELAAGTKQLKMLLLLLLLLQVPSFHST